jgi:5,10-methylenetetrahydromethanopterin reductase
MKLGIFVHQQGSEWKDALEKVKLAEDMGYDWALVTEGWGNSAIPWLTAVVLNTTKITVGTGILNCFSRSPAVMAQEFSALDIISNGRMILGLGSSGEFVVEHFHGIPFRTPLKRLKEYVEIFDKLISGERLEYSGDIFKMSRGFQLQSAGDLPRNNIPVYIASITPKSIKQTSMIADGIMPIHWPKEQLPALKNIMQEPGDNKKNPNPTIALNTRVTILDGKDDELKWQSSKQTLFHYINRMGHFYRDMLINNGFEDEVLKSEKAWSDQNRQESIDAITDDMVRSIQVIGSPSEIREQLQERSDLGGDVQVINLPNGDINTVRPFMEHLIG